MKKLIYLVCFTLFFSSVQAQQSELEKQLIKKWYMDTVQMKPVVEEMLSKRQDMASLDELNQQVAIQTALKQISGNTIEYKASGEMLRETSTGISEGTWKLDKKKNEILTKTGNEKRKKFLIMELTNSKLHIKNEEGLDLIFYAK